MMEGRLTKTQRAFLEMLDDNGPMDQTGLQVAGGNTATARRLEALGMIRWYWSCDYWKITSIGRAALGTVDC